MSSDLKTFDVIVVGGGISGSIAAISAARMGVKTLLIEQYGCLGGALTACGVGPMMTFHAGNKLVVKGITNEVIERLAAKGKSPGHIFDTTGYTYTVTPFDSEALKRELEGMLLEAGGKILYHAMLCETEVQDNIITQIKVSTMSGGMLSLAARVFIDATGDASLAVMAGVPFTKGRRSDGVCQPLTTNLKMYNVDINRIKEYAKEVENIDQFPDIPDVAHMVEKAQCLSLFGFVNIFQEARKRGELSFLNEHVLFFETNNPGEVIVNTAQVCTENPTDPWQLSDCETKGRQQALELEQFLRRRIPGFEKAILTYTSPSQIGIRSSRQIVGKYTLTEDDLLNCVKFKDVIAHGGYHIDVHETEDGYDKEILDTLNRKMKMEWGEVYGVPYRSLLNDKVPNVIVVGRCISATNIAQGAIRVSPIAGAIGHGGGVAAAMAASAQVLPEAIDVNELQNNLVAQNAYLER